MSILNIKQSFILYKHLAIFTRLCLFVNTRCVYSTQLRGSFCSRMLRQISHLFVLIQLCDEWYENMDQGKLNGVVFLDIPNAFDSIDHKILISKLETHDYIDYIAPRLKESLIRISSMQVIILETVILIYILFKNRDGSSWKKALKQWDKTLELPFLGSERGAIYLFL
jgi:hypothetical protein